LLFFSCFFFDLAVAFSPSSEPISLKPSSSPPPPVRLVPVDCSNKTSWFALMWICLCSRGVKTLAPPLGKDFSSSLNTLGLGAALSGFDFAGDGSAATSDFRRFADRSLDAPFSFFDGVFPSAFRLIAPMLRIYVRSCRVRRPPRVQCSSTFLVVPAPRGRPPTGRVRVEHVPKTRRLDDGTHGDCSQELHATRLSELSEPRLCVYLLPIYFGSISL
jgi:hypothetical protein